MDESRRDVIKKAVVAGAIVWTAPVIESVTHAAAGTPLVGTTTSTTTTTTTVPTDCGGCRSHNCFHGSPVCAIDPDSSDFCLCVQTTEGDCFCAYGSGNPCAFRCSSSADCPADRPRCVVYCTGPDLCDCFIDCGPGPPGVCEVPCALPREA